LPEDAALEVVRFGGALGNSTKKSFARDAALSVCGLERCSKTLQRHFFRRYSSGRGSVAVHRYI
jgi:hypothetical protein